MAIFDISINWSLIFVLATLTTAIYRRVKKGRLPYPPGPKKWPIIGNMFSIPEDQPWIAFKQWSEEKGSDVISVEVLGSHMVVLNSSTAVRDIMDKRSSNYSDRQGWTWNFAFMPYGPVWKEHRRVFRQEAEYPEARLHQPHALLAARRFIKHVLHEPITWTEHLRHMAGLVVLSTAYGIDVKPQGDPFIEIAEKAMGGLAKGGNTGTYLVDFIPALKYIPEWFPGAGFQKEAKEWYKWVTLLPDAGFQLAKANYVSDAGTGKYCIAARVLDKLRDDPDRDRKEKVLRNALGVFYSAGSDTTVSSISTFVLAMVLNPDIQQKLRSAVEAVVGTDRLPEFEDVEPIDYLHAVVKETLRWQPVTPLAVAHGASDDDVYNGYHIPKGAAVVGNSWALLREEGTWGPHPDQFRPERFLTTDGKLNPAVPHPDSAFGFGRRICPGRIIAYSSMMITCASLLQCFNIIKQKDIDGQEITPKVEYTTGLLSFPKPFDCEFQVRSETMRRLMEEGTEIVEH
ncbi:cytochrome P450 [Pluteus cervinus]|uniref:Cytochrome P450 n=1 Tax=Pluteus cervinus TaxID=181527 RepID=A0ACD3B5K3_9AGAR|nr:cytochrome P450 [Pluteus cervinus]